MTLKLNAEATKLMHRFFGEFSEPRSDWKAEKIQRYDATERSYRQLSRIILYVNQGALELGLFSPGDIEDLISALSRLHESRYWRDVSFKTEGSLLNAATEYDDMEWLLIDRKVNRGCGFLQESYRMTSMRLLRLCKHSLPLENCLIRLMNSYHLGSRVCDRGIKALEKGQVIPLAPLATKGKRRPRPFELNYTNETSRQKISEAKRRIINAAKCW